MTQAHLPPDDADLARLLGDAVRQDVEGPVDAHRLVAGAQRGAIAIRRRRRTGVAVLAVVVLAGIPVGLLRTGGSSQVDSAGSQASAPLEASASASAAASATAVAGSVAGQPPAPGSDLQTKAAEGGAAQSGIAVVPGPTGTEPYSLASISPSPAARLVPSAASPRPPVQVPVPDGALLVAGDLPQAGLGLGSDTANKQPAAPSPASATCGRSLPAPPAAGSRAVTFQRRSGPAATGWQLGSTVRVLPGTGAATYLAAARRLPCAAVVAQVGDGAAGSRGQRDSTDRTHYFAVVRIGRTISEITLIVPKGGPAAGPDLNRLLSVAAGRLNSSGLAARAAADPALAG
jgi:hypothetical protein